MPFYAFNWQGRRDSNPQPADLESAALAVGATALLRINLFAFFMRRMFTAKFAILFEFELIRSLLFILGGRVILTFALGTIQTHYNSHDTSSKTP